MNIIKKTMVSALLTLSALGLSISQPASADGASDAAMYCVGCHDGLTVNGVTVGGGQRSCPQRTVAEWTATIDRMNGKGCGVPANAIAGMASYLAGLGGSTSSSSTTSTTSTSTTTSTTFPPTANDYDMGITVTASSTYLLSNALDSYGVSYSATVTNFGPSAGVADVHLQMNPDRVWSGSLSANCVRYQDGCRATLAAGEQATITVSSYVRLGSSLSLTLSIADVAGDMAFETNIANNTATVSFDPPVPPPTATTCYDTYGNSFTVSGWCPLGSTANPPPTCASGTSPYLGYVAAGVWSWSCEATTTTSTTQPTVTSTTTTTSGITCYKPTADGLSYTTEISYIGYCSSGWAYSPPPPCPGGTLSIVQNHMWLCTVTTSSTTSSSTTTSTTTTTLCNTYVNGTTQYPYSGSGSCHGHPDNDSTTGHVVRDQKWCRKHMTHFNSSGNHTHAYPHPACM